MSGITSDPLSESSHGLPVVVEKDTGFRRFFDKGFWGLLGVVSLLGTGLWALTWKGTVSAVEKVDQKTVEIDKEQRQHAERIRVLEVHHQDMKDDLKELKKGQGEVLEILRKK